MEFYIIGTGSDEQRLRRMVKELALEDQVRFLGQIPHEQVVQELLNADIFVFPTYHTETCSLVLLEAMAAGLPIITTDKNSNSDLVVDEEGGFLVHPQNHAEVKEAVIYLQLFPRFRKSFGSFNKRRAKRYDWGIVAQRFNDLLREKKKND